MKIVISREAAADIGRLHAFLAEHDAAAAARAVGTIMRGIDLLEHVPERGHPSGIPGVRELILPFGNSA